MKKMMPLLLTLLLGLFATDCRKSVAPVYDLALTLAMPQGFTVATVPPGVEIHFINTQTDRDITAVSDASGSVVQMLVEGNYNVKCSFTMKVDGIDYIFNGTMSNLMLTKGLSANVDLVLAKNAGGFVFKEIYFSGSKTPDGKTYFSDQFHEIYNNSNDTLFADNLCIGLLEQTSSNPNVWVNKDGSVMDNLPLTFQIWTLAGTGKQYPVYPGKSIIIAQDGINHKTDPNGNPASPVDLSNADWESYVEAAGKDTDSPGVKNMTLMYSTSASMVDWLHSVSGSAVVIFRLPTDWQSYVANAANFMTKPNSTSTTKYFMLDKNNVIDAVEIVLPEATKQNKRLPLTLDAGNTYLVGGTYCSKSIRRKAKMIVGGRVIYKDTNNSTVDFLHDLTPTPGVNPTTVEN